MREIDTIIIHCADTFERMDIGVKEIDQWHKKRGFAKVGYHFVIRRDGTIETGREIKEIGAHAQGHNQSSIGICWVGGRSNDNKAEDNRTEEQKEALTKLITKLVKEYKIDYIIGHSDVDNKKVCPCFNARMEYQYLTYTIQKEIEHEKAMEEIKWEENKYRSFNNADSTGDEIDFSKPNTSGNSRLGNIDWFSYWRGWSDAQSGKDTYVSSSTYPIDQIEKSISLKKLFKISFSLEKFINFIKNIFK